MTAEDKLPSGLLLWGCATGAFRQIVVPVDVALAAKRLGLCDLEVVQRHLDLGLRAALTHDTYLHEHPDEAPHLTRGVLRALEALGGSWLSRELALSAYRRKRHEKPGPLSDVVALGRTRFGTWSATVGWIAETASVGRSLNRHQLPEGVTKRLALQLLGLLCLLGRDELAKRFAAPFLQQISEEAHALPVEPMTALQDELNRTGLSAEWTFEPSGPDHDRTFKACVLDKTGRTACGEGRSKKAARSDAASQFLRTYHPEKLRQRPPEPFKQPVDFPKAATERHRAVVTKLAERLQVPSTDLPLLSQAFMHSSWTYENAADVASCLQQDNQVLGHVGSHVLHYEYALVAVHEAVRSAPDTFALQTLLNETYAKALLVSDLGPGLLLGVGQRDSIGIELAANAFQAAMAAVFLALGAPRSLLENWPTDWKNVSELIAPRTVRPQDPSTQLQELATASGFSWDYTFSAQGPDHVRRYTAVLTLESPCLHRRLTIKGEPASGQTQAKHDVSWRVIDYARRLVDPAETVALSSSSSNRPEIRSIPTFLLAHLAAVASAAPEKARIWRRQELFGAHLAAQPRELSTWARGVDRLLSQQKAMVPDAPQLAEFFRLALGSDANAQGNLREELAQALGWVCNLEDPNRIEDLEVARLVHLAAAYRGSGEDQAGGTLRALLDDLSVLHRGRLSVQGEVPAVELTGVELSVVEALARGLTTQTETLEVHFTQANSLVFTPVPAPDDHVQFLIRVWGELSHRVPVEARPEGVVVGLPRPEHGRRGPVQSAVEVALQPGASPLSAAIANLLHDLKNQVLAARQAARTRGGGRTSELERRAAASRHLDQASALAQRVRAATSLLAAPSEQTTELSDFMRRYSAATLLQLPANVSLVPPRTTGEATAALDEPSLLALLNNLIKNSVEAMPQGGTITLEWIHDNQVAVLEVADDGPGVPRLVQNALTSGRRIESSKPGGNGLGLLGVRALLRRVGGDLELVSATSGTRWHLTVPLAQPMEVGEADEHHPS
ncbi:ATP-binding protein [Micromonospora chersina]